MKKVQQYGGRFLKRGHGGLWYEVPEREARRKASQGEKLSSSKFPSCKYSSFMVYVLSLLSTSRKEMGLIICLVE